MAYLELNVEQVTREADLQCSLSEDQEDSLANVIDPRIDLPTSAPSGSSPSKYETSPGGAKYCTAEPAVYPDISFQVARYLAAERPDLCAAPCKLESVPKATAQGGGSPLRAPLTLSCDPLALKQSTIGASSCPQGADPEKEDRCIAEDRAPGIREDWSGSPLVAQKDLPSVHQWKREATRTSVGDDTHSVCSETESTFSFWSHDGELRSLRATVAVQTEAEMVVARLEGELESMQMEFAKALQEKAELQLSSARHMVAQKEAEHDDGAVQIRELEERVQELEAEALRYRRVLGDFEGLLSQKDAEAEALRDELTLWHTRERELRAVQEELKVELEARAGASEGLKRKLADLHVEVQALQSERAQLEGQNRTLRSDVTAAHKAKEWFRQQLHDSQQSRDELHREHVAAQAKSISLAAEVQQLSAREARAQRELATTNQRALQEKAELAQRLEEIEAQWLAAQGGTLDAAMNGSVANSVTLESVARDHGRADLEQQLDSIARSLAAKEEALVQAAEERVQLAQEVHELRSKLNESEFQRQQSESRLRESIRCKERVEAELSNAKETLQELRSEQARTLSALAAANEEKSAIQASVSELSANVARLEANFKVLHSQLLAKCSQVEELERKTTTEECTQLRSEIAQLQQKVLETDILFKTAKTHQGEQQKGQNAEAHTAEDNAHNEIQPNSCQPLDCVTHKGVTVEQGEALLQHKMVAQRRDAGDEITNDRAISRAHKSSLGVLTRKLRETRHELKLAQAELEQYRSAARGTLVESRHKVDTDSLRAENQQLLLQLEKEQGKVEGCRQVQSQLGSHAAELEKQLAEKEAHIAQLLYQIKQAQDRASSEAELHANQVDSLNQELSKEQSLTKDLRQKVCDEKRRSRNLTSQLAAAVESLHEAQAASQAKQLEAQGLSKELQQREEALAQVHGRVKDLVEQLAQSHNKVRDLEAQLQSAHERDPALEQHMKLLSWKLKEESQQVAALKEQAKMAQSAHQEEMEALQKMLQEAQKRCQGLSSELSLARKEKLALLAHVQELRTALRLRLDQCKELQKELLEVAESARVPQLPEPSPCEDAHISRLLQQCAAPSGSGPLGNLQDCLHSLKQELHSLQSQMKQQNIPEASSDAVG